MPNRTIHARYTTVSASKLVDAVAADLQKIKEEDGLTDAEIGGFLGRGPDQGAKYRTGLAEMSMTSFLRGCERWNGRFANGVMALIRMRMSPLDTDSKLTDRASFTAVCALLHEMSGALEDDGVIDDDELSSMKRTVEQAGQVIDRLRDRLKLRSVA